MDDDVADVAALAVEDTHSHVWKQLGQKTDSSDTHGHTKGGQGGTTSGRDHSPIVFFVRKGGGSNNSDTSSSLLSLTDAVRKYTGGRLGTHGNNSAVAVLQVDMNALYDILGMLRSLQYDLKLYNDSIRNIHNNENSKNVDDEGYACFRLEQQALACGVGTLGRHDANNNIQSVEGLDALIAHIETCYCDRIAAARQYSWDCNEYNINNNKSMALVDFDSLQEYCSPGRILLDTGLLTGLSHVYTAVRCRSCRYRRSKTAMGNVVSVFEASVECVVALGGDGDGDGLYAVVETVWHQSEFTGTRSVAANGDEGSCLLLLPTPELLTALQHRGHLYQTYNTSGTTSGNSSGTMADYSAETFWPCFVGNDTQRSSSSSSMNAARPFRTSGRMMVDPHEAWTRGVHPCKPPADGAASDAVLATFASYARFRRQQQTLSNTKSSHDNGTAATAKAFPNDILLARGRLPECLVALTWPVVCGFSLVGRVWGVALVEGLLPVQFAAHALDALVLPRTRKRLLQALVSSHHNNITIGGGASISTDNSSNSGIVPAADVMPGKGEGLIILLYGPPGVGKTLTAEAVAEILKRPLYRVSMGELGTTPERLEERLQEIFDLCLPWKALVLIDEAEMLLETRRSGNGTDLVRNAMVCVMLRLLEYYPGILFLTTNIGIDELDPAVASRITCALHYEALDLEGRREIWRKSLERVIGCTADDENTKECDNTQQVTTTAMKMIPDTDLTALATAYAHANGRQIKNAVQLASIVCRHENVSLTIETLRETLELTATMSFGSR